MEERTRSDTSAVKRRRAGHDRRLIAYWTFALGWGVPNIEWGDDVVIEENDVAIPTEQPFPFWIRWKFVIGD